MAPGEGRRVYHTPVGLIEVHTHPCVYEPAEDSLLAIKAVKLLADNGFMARVILDLGTGTGIISAAASRIFPDSVIISVDVNRYALVTAKRSLEGVNAIIIACNWSSCIKGPIDLSIVNPPYLPVEDALQDCPELTRAWSSSPELLEELCRNITGISNAVAIVYSSLSGWEPSGCIPRRGFKVVGVLKESYFMEELYALVAVREGGIGQA